MSSAGVSGGFKAEARARAGIGDLRDGNDAQCRCGKSGAVGDIGRGRFIIEQIGKSLASPDPLLPTPSA